VLPDHAATVSKRDHDVTNRKGITLCADDYALSAPVSAGILELARSGRLHAVSCMTDSPRWAEDGALLRDLPGVEIGLHLNFTEPFAAAAADRGLLAASAGCGAGAGLGAAAVGRLCQRHGPCPGFC